MRDKEKEISKFPNTDYDEELEKKVIRRLRWFTKKRGKMVGEEEFTDLSLFQLREIFNVTDSFYKRSENNLNSDPYMFDCYDVEDKHLDILQHHIKHKIRLFRYDYFVVANARML